MSFLGTLGRVGAAVSTAGLSEALPAIYSAIKPKKIDAPPTTGSGSATFGTVDNPDWLAWQARKTDIQNQIAADPGWGNDPNGGKQELINLGPEPPRTVQVDTTAGAYADTQAQGQQASQAVGSQVARINGVADQYAQNAVPQQTQAQQVAGSAGAAGRAPITNAFSAVSSPAVVPPPPPASVANLASQFQGAVPTAQTPNYAAQGQQAANRAAPQMQVGGAGASAQQQALQAAQGFQPDTSGIGGIQAARADTSGAAPLSGFQTDQRGIQKLDTYQPANATGGIKQLQNFNSSSTIRGATDLQNLQNPNGAVGQLNQFQADQRGVDALNGYAQQAQGPSAAQALLQSQSDKDIRAQIAIARSARGGPAAIAAAQRQAQSEGAAIAAETRGQASALSAQETDTFKQRQLTALGQAGQLGLSASGQKLQAMQASGQLITDQNAQQLQAKVAAGQLLSQADQQKLSAYQSATQALTAQDQQVLSANTAAAQARAQADATKQTALANAAQVKLQGSQINQQGAVAASNAQLAASGQQLQALSLQGQISDSIRTADVNVLKSNLDASLQQANLNDTQVRAFAQMQEDARQANQNAQLQAAQLGLNAAAVQSAIDLQWAQMAQSQLTTQQQMDLAKQGIQVSISQANQANSTAFTGQLISLAGTGAAAAGKASDERAKKNIRPVSSAAVAKALRDSPGSAYEYTEPHKPGRDPGTHITPMAQGLQKSKLFAPAVSPDKDGTLMVDGTRLALAHHTALSHLQREIDEIKKHRKGKKQARA